MTARTGALLEYQRVNAMMVTIPMNFWSVVMSVWKVSSVTNSSPTKPMRRKAVCSSTGNFSISLMQCPATKRSARIPMKTPVQTTHISSLKATAATTLSTPRLRSISSIDATVAQNPRPADFAITSPASSSSTWPALWRAAKWWAIRWRR